MICPASRAGLVGEVVVCIRLAGSLRAAFAAGDEASGEVDAVATCLGGHAIALLFAEEGCADIILLCSPSRV
jgi:hypothetical protein